MALSNNDLKSIESAVAAQVAPLADEIRGAKAEVSGLKSEVRGLASEVHSVKLVQDTHTEQLAAVQASLSSHTRVLDAIVKNTEDWRTERAALAAGIHRHESWIQKLAAHLGLKL